MHTLWVGIETDEVLCHGPKAYDAVQALRAGRRFIAGPGLFLEAIRDSSGTVIGFGIVISQVIADVVARDTAVLEPFERAARRVLCMRGIVASEQLMHVHIQDDIPQMNRRT